MLTPTNEHNVNPFFVISPSLSTKTVYFIFSVFVIGDSIFKVLVALSKVTLKFSLNEGW